MLKLKMVLNYLRTDHPYHLAEPRVVYEGSFTSRFSSYMHNNYIIDCLSHRNSWIWWGTFKKHLKVCVFQKHMITMINCWKRSFGFGTFWRNSRCYSHNNPLLFILISDLVQPCVFLKTCESSLGKHWHFWEIKFPIIITTKNG